MYHRVMENVFKGGPYPDFEILTALTYIYCRRVDQASLISLADACLVVFPELVSEGKITIDHIGYQQIGEYRVHLAIYFKLTPQ